MNRIHAANRQKLVPILYTTLTVLCLAVADVRFESQLESFNFDHELVRLRRSWQDTVAVTALTIDQLNVCRMQ